ncbi:MAG TPA: selenide, water dikinase SelD [Candidatus Nanopelagicaceae bacterium]|nr:selenide, water dikinase SelD [Candidatus Nanopelagicaceae bacterium]
MRLTELTGQGGCSAKIAQADLASILAGIATPAGGDLLVSAETMDDAAVYRLSGDLALVATTDFFPPPVDDPRDYGAIATANSLSDIYAMGGAPILLLNLVGFDLASLEGGILRQILEGGAEVAREAGCAIAGGHSIRSPEPLFGCAVVGRVDPRRMMTNATARVGDLVFLTKPLGTGVILNSHKAGQVAPADLAGAVATMRHLNRDAADAMLRADASAATDVTGFGLLGHVHNLARASGVRVSLRAQDLPALPGAFDLIAKGHIPGGSRRNRELARTTTDVAPTVTDNQLWLACDAQTSGGLVVTISVERAVQFTQLLPSATLIGEVLAAIPGKPELELS